jgi:D-tyrosyl-tRNA(Tyr) deacylase
MRAVLQRVTEARVKVDNKIVGEIESGLLVLLGVGCDDREADAAHLAEKTSGLRIFEDDAGKMNLSVKDVGGAVLSISQFTLYGDCRKGRRPGFSAAAPPDVANRLYEHYISCLRQQGLPVATGIFQADMAVELVNDGPVTMLLDSERVF